VLTAAHCIQDIDSKTTITIKRSRLDFRPAYGKVFRFNTRADVGLVEGDFSAFPTAYTETDAIKTHDIFTNSGSNLVACGFPYGGKFTCSRFVPSTQQSFHYLGYGFLYPGMSGGPVFDLDTDSVVAVNCAVDGNQIVVSPLVELLDMLSVER